MVHTRFFADENVPPTLGTALVVDTDPTEVHALASMLRARGYSVLEATSFRDAQRQWNARQPQILVADIRLGEFNGLQLLIRARAEHPELVAVITSPVPDRMLAEETRRFGGTFFVKPVASERVLEAIGYQAALEGRLGDMLIEPPPPGLPTRSTNGN